MSAPEQVLRAEEAVLGSLFLDPTALPLVAAILAPEDFAQASYRAIYAAIRGVARAGHPVDVVSVGDELDRLGLLDGLGGVPALAGFLAVVPSAIHAERYAGEVKRAALRRALAEIGAKVSALADDSRDVADLITDAQAHLLHLTERATPQTGVVLRDALDDYWAELQDLLASQGQLRGVQTGFVDINTMTGGWQKDDLVVLAARPGVGKTSLALMLALNAALAGNAVAFFSIEMPAEQLAQRAIAVESGVDAQRLRLGSVTDGDLGAIRAAMGRLAPLPVTIYDTPALSLTEMRAHALRQRAAGGVGIIFVDYLQLMRGASGGREMNRQVEVAAISRGLKGLARELGVPVVALAQLNRAVEGRASHRPQLSDLRESGAIEQDADMVIFVHREEMYDEEAERGVADLIVAKHRNGPLGTVRLRFHHETTRFGDFVALDPAEGAPF